jgi:hypothetical protein
VRRRDRLGPEWRTSSRSETGACVEVKYVDGAVLVRNSRNPAGPVLSFTPEQWRTFVHLVTTDRGSGDQ